MSDYFDTVHRLLSRMEETQVTAIDQAAAAAARGIGDGGVLHMFGSGHSMLAAIDSTMRAGGLAAVHLLHDPALSPAEPEQVARTERLHGYAAGVIERGDLRPGETLIVVSNSGINAVPIEIATGARRLGLTAVAVTAVAHSTGATSRHESGLRLLEVADIVVDTGAPHGDAVVDMDGVAIGPVSTILATAAVHAIIVRTTVLLSAAGADVPVLISQNVDDFDDHNDRLRDRYRRTSPPSP